jgi:hypothetical protein
VEGGKESGAAGQRLFINCKVLLLRSFVSQMQRCRQPGVRNLQLRLPTLGDQVSLRRLVVLRYENRRFIMFERCWFYAASTAVKRIHGIVNSLLTMLSY